MPSVKIAKKEYGYGYDPLCGHSLPDPVLFHHGNKVQTSLSRLR